MKIVDASMTLETVVMMESNWSVCFEGIGLVFPVKPVNRIIDPLCLTYLGRTIYQK